MLERREPHFYFCLFLSGHLPAEYHHVMPKLVMTKNYIIPKKIFDRWLHLSRSRYLRETESVRSIMELLVADDIDINLKIHTGWAAVDKDEFIFEES